MSYVDSLFDKSTDTIHVVERVDGKRIYKEYPANHILYYDDPKGKFKTIYGTPVSRFSSHSSKIFYKELRMHPKKTRWESDMNPVVRCLSENYLNAEPPELHVCFFDIEVDFHKELGFAETTDPFNKITAISVYLSWLDKLVTLALPPDGMSGDLAKIIVDKYSNCFIFEKEEDLLKTFLAVIEDADILSGWNSEGYDIPYTVNRITRVLSKDDTRQFCLWGQYPKPRSYERYGAEQSTYDLIGRVHLDYMQLYKKYTYNVMHSYSLNAISEHELGDSKVVYNGTLDELYNKDFEKFLAYNRQDTMLLFNLDNKLKYIDLASNVAHENTVLIPSALGAVAVTEQAIINEAHSFGLIVPNKKDNGDSRVPGAYVAVPKRGIHEWIGAIDLASLYPSTIRALNMGNETIVGQLRPIMTSAEIEKRIAAGATFAEAWAPEFGSLEYQAVMEHNTTTEITIDWEDGRTEVYSAAQVWDMIFRGRHNWVMSANGTIFTLDKNGIIPGLLARWYDERKELQAKERTANSEEKKEFWDKRQLVKKINLNSLYGAILNPYCRFFDWRIGQSTTLTGRCITKHMAGSVNETLTGKYDYMGDAVIYGDTDSVYFSAWPMIQEDVEKKEMDWDDDICVKLYDKIANTVNESFPEFMMNNFNAPKRFGELIHGSRELAGWRGLFIKKKRYGILVFDKEGERYEKGKLKVMGIEIKRSDTPKAIQVFLSDVLDNLLNGAKKEELIKQIIDFKISYSSEPAWEKGRPIGVNRLTYYRKLEEKLGKAGLPGHVRASLNWNLLREMNSDSYSLKITDGMKIVVCKLKTNPLGYTSVARPIDELHLPQWFKDLPFDEHQMEKDVIDTKIENLLGVLEWDIAPAIKIDNTFNQFFQEV